MITLDKVQSLIAGMQVSACMCIAIVCGMMISDRLAHHTHEAKATASAAASKQADNADYSAAEKHFREKLSKAYPGKVIALQRGWCFHGIDADGHKVSEVGIKAAIFNGNEMESFRTIEAYVVDGVTIEKVP